jgi:hypothetical protein
MSHKTAIVAGNGPSLTPGLIRIINQQKGKHRIFGCNNAIFYLDLDAHLACNYQWWDFYAEQVKEHPCDKWTPRKESAEKYPWVRYIEERWEDGLSTDKSYICAHHGSGPQILNIALHYGYERFLLIGWDMRYPGKISNHQYNGQRHFFGEYPSSMQHWPRTGQNGELTGLIKEMETIKPERYGIEIINCSPGSAMKCFPMSTLEEELCLK